MAISCNPQDLITAARCFFCVKPSAKQAVKSFLLCQFATAPPAPPALGLSLTDTSGATVLASWGAIPTGSTATQVWSSTDGVNFSLSSTVASPGQSANVPAPGASNTLFVKIRSCAGGNCGFFSPVVTQPGRVSDWAARVVINGGAAVSLNTLQAMDTFWKAILSGGLNTLMKAINCFAPDNLTAVRTPLLVGAGNDPWPSTTNAPAAGNLSVNGWASTDGAGGTQVLQTGIIPSSISTFNAGNGGMTFYGFTVPAQTAGRYNSGVNDGTNWLFLDMNDTGANPPFYIFAAFNNVAGASVQSNNGYRGYFSGSLVAANNMVLYFANSTNAHAVLATQGAVNTNTPPTKQVYVGGQNNNAVLVSNTNSVISFWAIHDALTAAQSQSLFNAVQSLRTTLGGGFV